MTGVIDRFERPLRDLRISVTDRCNLRCPYCMPREVFGRDYAFMPRHELLSFEELARLCRVFARVGVRKVRLTGGEPLLRNQLELLVAQIAAIPEIEDLALTTNGTLLARNARALCDAGLRRVTVSLDALDPAVFTAMSDARAPLAAVLAGIDAARAAGLTPVKINMVVRRGVNEHCVIPMAEHFRGRDEIVRFIEYMDVGMTERVARSARSCPRPSCATRSLRAGRSSRSHRAIRARSRRAIATATAPARLASSTL